MSGHGNQHLDTDSAKPSPNSKRCLSMLTGLQCLPQLPSGVGDLKTPPSLQLVAVGHGVTTTESKLVQKETTRMRFPTHTTPFLSKRELMRTKAMNEDSAYAFGKIFEDTLMSLKPGNLDPCKSFKKSTTRTYIT